MVSAFGLSAPGTRLPTQSTSNHSNTSSTKNIVSTSEKSTTPTKESASQDPPKSGKMSALKSMLQKNDTVKRAPSVASTSTEAPLLDRNGKQVHNYNTAEMMRGQFRFTSG